jgi:hypothetical protein
VLLLITSEPNVTSDFITLGYGDDIFRLNVNLWRDYRIAFTRDGWEIANAKTDRRIDSGSVTRAYWWKAFSTVIDDDNYVKEEIRYTIYDIYGWCLERGVVKGNSPLFHRRHGKLTILGKAKKYFTTPRTLVSIGLHGVGALESKAAVAKSLSSEATNDNKVMMTTEVDVARLDPRYPWYLQEKIESAWDVTVFYCDKKCFAFRRSRKRLKGLDWRAEQFSHDRQEPWEPMRLAAAEEARIRALSGELSVEIGRYDFLTIGDTDGLVFLEFNASGQWLFLDPERQYGLVECVVAWLKA